MVVNNTTVYQYNRVPIQSARGGRFHVLKRGNYFGDHLQQQQLRGSDGAHCREPDNVATMVLLLGTDERHGAKRRQCVDGLRFLRAADERDLALWCNYGVHVHQRAL